MILYDSMESLVLWPFAARPLAIGANILRTSNTLDWGEGLHEVPAYMAAEYLGILRLRHKL
jgi:hypothetical protein